MRKKLSTNKYGQLYLPAELRDLVRLPKTSGGNVEAIANAQAIFLMPEGMAPQDALKSLEVIKKHLELETEIQTKG